MKLRVPFPSKPKATISNTILGLLKQHLSSFLTTLNILSLLFHTRLELLDEKEWHWAHLPTRKTFFDDLRALTRYPSNHAMFIAAVLPPCHLNRGGVPFIQHSVIEQNIGILGQLQQWFYVVPQQARSQFLAAQVAIDAVMADSLKMSG